MNARRWLVAIMAGTLVLGASGCATRNMLNDGSGAKAMLAGNDPVSYHTQPAPVKGDARLTYEWDGGTYRFATAANRDLFAKEPAKYAPQYGGYCSNGAPYSILLGGSANSYKVVDGRLFMFSDGNSRKYWELDQARNIELGDRYWQTEMKDTWSAFVHSYKRIVFKVPHYKSGKQLADELAAREGRK